MKRIIVLLAILLTGSIKAYATQIQDHPIPSQEQDLINTFSKFNQKYDEAPNNIQKLNIEQTYKKAFCHKIPKNKISGWVGSIDSIESDPKNKGLILMISLPKENMVTGNFGIELSLGNDYSGGMSISDIKTLQSTIIRYNSKLYKKISMMRIDDTVIFSGKFIPFANIKKCYSNILYTTYFSLFRFSKVKSLSQ